MLGQLDLAGHPEVGLGLLPVMAVLMVTVIVPAATADDIALVPLMTPSYTYAYKYAATDGILKLDNSKRPHN